MKPWIVVGTVETAEGRLELRRRDRDFLLVIGGRVLMSSANRISEQRLATLGCAAIADRAAPNILIGGLGMGFTLRAALDALPARARLSVAELEPQIAAWCRDPLAGLTGNAVGDPRVRVLIGDVSRVIAEAAPGSYDAILLDLYEGPNATSQRANDPCFGRAALERARSRLAEGGVLAVWAEDHDEAFVRRFRSAGFDVTIDRSGTHRIHVVYLGQARRRSLSRS